MLATSNFIAIIPTKDFTQARNFYENILQLRFLEEDAFALVFQAHHALLRIVKIPDFQPAPYTLHGWQVSNIGDEVRELEASGVLFERYPWFEQDDLGIWTAPNGSLVAWFKDPDGNVLSASQHKL